MSTVVADTLPHQMNLLNNDKVNGLVGQVPYQMGVGVVDYFVDYHAAGGHPPALQGDTILGTVLHEVVTVPLDLPIANLDHHLIGSWRFFGFGWTSLQCLVLSIALFGLFNVASIALVIMLMSMVDEKVSTQTDLDVILEDENCDSGVLECTGPVWLLSIAFA